jgi:hypothetical protein
MSDSDIPGTGLTVLPIGVMLKSAIFLSYAGANLKPPVGVE